MSEEASITANSSKEEVAEYLLKKLNLKEEVKNKIINEDISGDILYDLDDKDFKNLGIKVGPLKSLKTLLQDIKKSFGEKEIKEKINKNSTSEEVADFFKNSLNYTESTNNLDGTGLIEMNDEDIKKLGLNLGQTKKLIRFINYFKTLKIELHEEIEIILTKESSKEEVAEYLKKKLNFSDKAIEALELDGKSLINLEESDFNEEEDLTEEEKEKLKNYLKEFKEKNQEEKEIILTKESTKEEVTEYLKKKLNFSDKAIEALELDGKSLINLEESDFNEEEDLTEEEKEKLRIYLKEFKEKNQEEKEIILTKESTKEEVAEYLKKKLNFSDKAIEALELDGPTLFSLKESDIDKHEEITEEEKIKFKNYLKEQNILSQNIEDKNNGQSNSKVIE